METIYKGIEPGTEIVDKDGHKVGTVHEVILNEADQLQMLTVQKGLIFKTDVGIPAVSIDRVEGGKVYLSVEKGTLTEMMRPDPARGPAGAQTAAAATDETVLAGDAVARPPNQVTPEPGVMHDVGTGSRTHDLGIGTAGVAGPAAGNQTMVTGGEGTRGPTQAQEPTSADRT